MTKDSENAGKLQGENRIEQSATLGTAREQLHISVRGLVEFIMRSGDIDTRHMTSSESAMQEGSRIHRMIQKRMGTDYQAEVPLKYVYTADEYDLIIEGRADGIIENRDGITIDEIKGTYRDLAHMKGPRQEHLAQAKCYAYIYGLQAGVDHISVQMTYCNLDTEEIRYFTESYPFRELEMWFEDLVAAYRKWADFRYAWKKLRNESIREAVFPFLYREGQKDLVSYVYRTIYHKRKLFIQAPTGVGKTISTMYPAIKAMEKGMGDQLFYLTAKTITRTVAENTIQILRDRGLRFKSVILTAKDKICFQEQVDCNPESCPYAKGHFNRVNEAMYDLLIHEDSFNRETVVSYAQKYHVCPFEFCLDMSLFADAIIGDYNYLFDPHVYLKRFFGDSVSGNYLFLIDEAHNLLERGREMYSASLLKEDFMRLKNALKEPPEVGSGGNVNRAEKANGAGKFDGTGNSDAVEEADENGEMTIFPTVISEAQEWEQETLSILTEEERQGLIRKKTLKTVLWGQGYAHRMEKQLEKCNKEFLALKRECEECVIVESLDGLVQEVLRLHSIMGEYLEESEDVILEVKEQILDLYFELSHFLDIYERVDEKYVKYTQLMPDETFMVRLFCVDPSTNLKECLNRGRSSILFSATFLPIQYYKSLLGGEEKDYEVYAKSIFDTNRRALLIAEDVTSKYTRRSDQEYYSIAKYIFEIVKNRHGNYMVFCPSYQFLQKVYEFFEKHFVTEDMECLVQSDYMTEEDREYFLSRFEGNRECDLQQDIHMEIEIEEDSYLIGFCVLGGIFSEGIDLKDDSLIGAIIVGTGLPQVCYEREILKAYFDEQDGQGFDYAYRFPGMNKVLQAAGRVIRTDTDVGVIALLDERFLQNSYRGLFPREWDRFEVVNHNNVSRRVERFWDAWL